MKTIRGTATRGLDGALTMRVPAEVAPGEHEVTLTLTVLDGSQADAPSRPPLAAGVTHLLAHNVADLQRFGSQVHVIPLVP